MRKVSMLLLVVLVVLISSVAQASIFKKLPFDEIFQGSSLVVQGKVLDIRSAWDEEGRFIVSYITVEVTDRFKGTSPERITVKEFGGTLDGMISQPIGFPRFNVGQETILFLNSWENDSNVFRVYGYCLGKYNITKQDNATIVVREDVHQDDVLLLGEVPTEQDIEQMPLKSFQARINSLQNVKKPTLK